MADGRLEQADSDHILYLDNAATTFPKYAGVYNQANAFYSRYGGNAGRGGNPLARASARLLIETREMLAAWLGAPSAESVIFTPSATHALNQAIFGASIYPDDVIYVTPFEHNSVLRPVEYLRQTKRVQVRQIPFAHRTYQCQMEKLEVAFQTEPPAIVCVTQASNVCGIMPPVQEISQLAKRANPQAVIVVDGAQTAGLYPLNLKDGLIDAFIFSGHKSLYGPYGVAGLVLPSKWKPTPLLFGGTGTFSESIGMPRDLPSAYEAGSHNIWAIAGLHAALQWLEQKGRETIAEHITHLAQYLKMGLVEVLGIGVYAPIRTVPSCGIISFTVEGISPQAIEAIFGSHGIAVRAGLHCAPWAHTWLGTTANGGTVRVSPGYFNEARDIEILLSELRQIASASF
jgi:cysteine desulfurase family protein